MPRRNRLDSFNRSLAAACASQGIEFATLNDRIMDQYGTIDGAFIDASPYNIHLLWEPLMDLWTRYVHLQQRVVKVAAMDSKGQ